MGYLKAENSSSSKKENEQGKVGRFLNVAAYPLSIGAGYYVTDKQIYNSSREQLSRRGAFKEDCEKMKEAGKQVLGEAENLSGEQVREKFKSIANTFEESVDKTFNKMGYKNMFHHFDHLPAHDRNSAIVNGLFAFGVSIGALLSVANSRILLKGDDENKAGGVSK
ncbi:MAG: hypothetical protein R3D71_10870 [Rickettsiales bacterium]